MHSLSFHSHEKGLCNEHLHGGCATVSQQVCRYVVKRGNKPGPCNVKERIFLSYLSLEVLEGFYLARLLGILYTARRGSGSEISASSHCSKVLLPGAQVPSRLSLFVPLSFLFFPSFSSQTPAICRCWDATRLFRTTSCVNDLVHAVARTFSREQHRTLTATLLLISQQGIQEHFSLFWCDR